MQGAPRGLVRVALSGLEEARGVRCGEVAFGMRETCRRVDLLSCCLTYRSGLSPGVVTQLRGGGGCRRVSLSVGALACGWLLRRFVLVASGKPTSRY
jgi:hypothetical protein